MNRLYALCILVLLVYGAVVGCSKTEHRETRVDEIREGRNTWVVYSCPHGNTPYMEVYRS